MPKKTTGKKRISGDLRQEVINLADEVPLTDSAAGAKKLLKLLIEPKRDNSAKWINHLKQGRKSLLRYISQSVQVGNSRNSNAAPAIAVAPVAAAAAPVAAADDEFEFEEGVGLVEQDDDGFEGDFGPTEQVSGEDNDVHSRNMQDLRSKRPLQLVWKL